MSKALPAFDFADIKESFSWPVRYEQPIGVDEKGNKRYKEGKFTAVFNMLDSDEIDTILKQGLNQALLDEQDYDAFDDDEQDEASVKKDKNLVFRLLKGWDDGINDNGEPVPVTDEFRAKLCNYLFMRTAIIKAFFASQGGRKAQRKN